MKCLLHILKNDNLLNSVNVGLGGYSITFNETIEISSSALREGSILLPVSANDILGFVRRNVVDTTTACNMLQCSRQNLSYLIKTKKLVPIICSTKESFNRKKNRNFATNYILNEE